MLIMRISLKESINMLLNVNHDIIDLHFLSFLNVFNKKNINDILNDLYLLKPKFDVEICVYN